MNAIMIIWSFIQKNWQAVLLVLAVIIGYTWIRHTQSNFATTLQQLNESHQAEITKINQSRVLEEQKHAAELKEFQDSLVKIQTDYANAQLQLQQRQIQEQQTIVRKYSNDTEGLAKLLAGKMGFAVVKP